MLGKVLITGIGLLVGYEAWKHYKASHGSVSIVPGNTYAVLLNFTKDPVAPVTQDVAQATLDANSPGEFNVINADMVPGPQGTARQMALQIIASGASASVASTVLTQNWPAGFGTVTIDSFADMGKAAAPPAFAPMV